MNSEMTKSTKLGDIKRSWHLFDVADKTLGRVASQISTVLMGKSKPYFVSSLDCGDYVVVINAEKVKVSGNKETLKKYSRHSGYPGGYKEEALIDLRKRKPEDIIRFAVLGMLPQNKLQDRMLTRLFIFKDENHTYADKFKTQKSEVKTGEKKV
jgi:large subunit ribosomal protein L13